MSIVALFMSLSAVPVSTVSAPDSITTLSRIQLSIENVGTTVVGRLDGKPVLVTQGYLRKNGQRYAALEAFTLRGRSLWRLVDDQPGNGCGEYIQWIDGPDLPEPLVLWNYFPDAKGGEGLRNRGGLFLARDGKRVHRFEKASNNGSLPVDLDGDGKTELIYCGQRFVSCFDLAAKTTRWTVTDRVFFCWSYPTVTDLNGDGTADVIWGSEYNLPGNKTSSMVAVDHTGKVLWNHDGIDEDLGSTPVFVADVDGDGQAELIKNGLDLVARNNLPYNHLFIFDRGGKLLRKIPSMMYSTGIGDLDGDGQLDAFGMVAHRDGGSEAKKRKQIRCVDLQTGNEKWTVDVDRVGLPAANALAADVNGDGALEAITADGNPTFYGHKPGPDWGAVYIISASGKLLRTITFAGWTRRLAMCDIDDDGFNELIVQVEGKPASIHVLRTKAPATARDWPLPFGNSHHWGREHRKPTRNRHTVRSRR